MNAESGAGDSPARQIRAQPDCACTALRGTSCAGSLASPSTAANREHRVEVVGVARPLVRAVAKDPSESKRDSARIPRAGLDPVEGDLYDGFRCDVHRVAVAMRLE